MNDIEQQLFEERDEHVRRIAQLVATDEGAQELMTLLAALLATELQRMRVQGVEVRRGAWQSVLEGQGILTRHALKRLQTAFIH